MSAGREYDKTDPLYYDQFFGMSEEVTSYEATLQDDVYNEYIQLYGHRFDVYLCSKFQPEYVFGEDPLKKYLAQPFVAKGIFEVTPETLTIGSWEKNTEQEELIVYFAKTTIRESIRRSLISSGLLEDDTLLDESVMTKFDRNRLDLQEGDIIRLRFNNIHYEIDGIKLEPEFQHHLFKYVYEVHARPRLVSGEELGDMQPVTDADKIREQHEYEIDTEADVILF